MNLVEILIFKMGRICLHVAMYKCLAQSWASTIVNLLLNSADRILRERLVSSFSFLTTASRCTLCICKWKTQNARSTQNVGRALVCVPARERIWCHFRIWRKKLGSEFFGKLLLPHLLGPLPCRISYFPRFDFLEISFLPFLLEIDSSTGCVQLSHTWPGLPPSWGQTNMWLTIPY